MNKPEMSNDELAKQLANRPAPSVTKILIESKIKNIEYLQKGVHTICYLTLENGFIVTGQSACADPKNYDQKIGEKIAYETAFREIWPLEGYLLRQSLFETDNLIAPDKSGAPSGKPNMFFVESANIAAIGYNAPRAEIWITFKSEKGAAGVTWKYKNIGEGIFKEFMKSSSKGKFFASMIKPNFEAEEVDLAKAA